MSGRLVGPKFGTEMLEIRDMFWTVHRLFGWLVLYLCVLLDVK